MRKFMFIVLFLASVVIISACSAQDPKFARSREISGGGGGGSTGGSNAFPVIDSFIVNGPYNCVPSNFSNYTLACEMYYSGHATDDKGIVSFGYAIIGGSTGIAAGFDGVWSVGIKDYSFNGNLTELYGPADYVLTVTVRDAEGSKDSKTKTFSVP